MLCHDLPFASTTHYPLLAKKEESNRTSPLLLEEQSYLSNSPPLEEGASSRTPLLCKEGVRG
jgi:hypothetical protein